MKADSYKDLDTDQKLGTDNLELKKSEQEHSGIEFFNAGKCEDKSIKNEKSACPLRELLSRLGDKWSVLLILTLARMPNEKARFSELKRSIPDISQRMLTATLRNLERDGLISREMFAEVPPRVEYQLTELGVSILNPMREFVKWIEGNWTTILSARDVFDQKNPKSDQGELQ
jgi:DNA-binding HxlR family transcriptional regulator